MVIPQSLSLKLPSSQVDPQSTERAAQRVAQRVAELLRETLIEWLRTKATLSHIASAIICHISSIREHKFIDNTSI